MRSLTCLLLILLVPVFCTAQTKHQFSLGKDDFLLDGKPYQIISGEIHPARIPVEYWRHRIQMIKAMGCNTVAAYIFWNYHESQPGVFDFTTGNKNIAAFIRICQQEGMWVLLRPGPYVCAEWDFGGLPTYLLKIPDIKIRCMDPRYITAVKRYVERLAKEVAPLQCSSGGPILMVQAENEYGSYGNDREYMNTIRQLWKRNGITVPLYTADGPTNYMLEAGSLPDAAIGLDSGSDEGDFQLATTFNSNVPIFSSETYPGWLTHWGEKWAKPDTNNLKKQVEFLLTNKKSFNLYVIHGGTNFGFTAGANSFSPTQFQADITSYDYDAPINENGQPTPKYFMLRNLIAKHVSYSIPNLPNPVKTIEIPAIELQQFDQLWNHLPTPVKSPQPKPMETYDQNQGLIIYKTKLIGHKSGKLKIWEPHDMAMVYLDGKFIDTIYRDGGKWEVNLPKTASKEPVLEIVVEGMGHINFAQFMIDRKGITDRVTLNGMTLMAWETYLLPMNEKFIAGLKNTPVAKTSPEKLCNFFKANFELKEVGDTYIDMSHYTKGMVYINGHLLGRYWHIGPQQRLYCPASWLKTGKNEVLVFDLFQQEAAEISGHHAMN